MESTNGPAFILKGERIDFIRKGNKRFIHTGDELLFKYPSKEDSKNIAAYFIQFHHATCHSTSIGNHDAKPSGKNDTVQESQPEKKASYKSQQTS